MVAVITRGYALMGMICAILKRAAIGKGTIVATMPVVTKNVLELRVVAKNSAKVVKKLDEYRYVFDEA